MSSIDFKERKIEYYVFDPTGNITALVETAVDVADQPAAAAKIMETEPAVEQVGFVTFADEDKDQPSECGGTQAEAVDVSLRMAGGEFCGNAAMCAAALYVLRGTVLCDRFWHGGDGSYGLNTACENSTGENNSEIAGMEKGADPAADAAADAVDRDEGTVTVKVRVSGAAEPVTVVLERIKAADTEPSACPPSGSDFDVCPASERPLEGAAFSAAVTMPPALSIDEIKFNTDSPSGSDRGSALLSVLNMDRLPLVRLEGIDHIIVEKGSAFYNLKDNKALAESFIKKWCGILGSYCLGIMFLGPGTDERELTPLVYVPGADTIFWESSCASGSAAAGIYLAARAGSPVDVTFGEPAGRLRVESAPLADTILHGTVILT